MKVQLYTQFNQLQNRSQHSDFQDFVQKHPRGNFFQSAACFAFLESTQDNKPFLLIAQNEKNQIIGSLLGVFQSNGNGLKSWFSRRLIVWGGPLIGETENAEKVAALLLQELKKYAAGRAIFAEFRNSFDTSSLQKTFADAGFIYKSHLNYLVTTDNEVSVKKRLSSNRLRQIKSSLKEGAVIAEADSEMDVIAFYHILEQLYREKVKKPLVGLDFFIKFWQTNIGKFFIIRYNDQVVGGIVCPIFANKVIYEWYVCGEDGVAKNVHPSVLATWAPIEYGLKNGFTHFDFMGAGKPEEDYGVREFKARFGGEEVQFGRYSLVLNKSLYKVGTLGLKLYHQIK